MGRHFLLFLLTLGSRALAGPLEGLTRVGDLGLADVTVDDNGLFVGQYRGDGKCAFAPGQTVFWGQFEGDVFVGSMLVCQRGPGCASQGNVPFLGLLKGRTLTARVHLPSGCASEAVDPVRPVVLRQATDDERATSKPPGPMDDAHRSAMVEAFETAKDSVKKKDFARAAEEFERSVAQAESFAAWSGLGMAEVELGNFPRAVMALQRALLLAKLPNQTPDDRFVGDAYFNLACAYVPMGKPRLALEALKKAFALSPDLVARSLEERRFVALRRDPAFDALVRDTKPSSAKPAAHNAIPRRKP